MSLDVALRGVTVRYGSTVALDAVDLDLRPGVITGLFGRNGSGKTTLASLLAAFRRPTAGSVRVGGQDPWENAPITRATALVRESGDVLVDDTIAANLDLAARARPTFSRQFAAELVEVFGLDPARKPGKLSRGKRSAVGIVLGLASRAPLTILDEVHLGLDAPSRVAFYDALLADYLAHPRTIVLSSHLIDEVDRLIEDVVVLDRGTVLLAQEAEDLRTTALTVSGPVATVDAFAADRRVLARQRLGGTAQVTVHGARSADAARAQALGLTPGPVPLQDLIVHLTSEVAS